ncbi:MAG TPA: glycosyl hydrolase 53 family protein, partial [Streptosporangiaceae bacterium]
MRAWNGAVIGVALAAGLLSAAAAPAGASAGAAGAAGAHGTTVTRGVSGAGVADGDQAAGVLPLLPDGLNVAIGAQVSANSGAAPGSSLGSIDDGDGTTRWCPSSLGRHRVTLDLGRVVQLTGTGVTFSGEEGSDGSFYSVSAGLSPGHETPLPDQAAGDRNTIVQGPLYLFAGSAADPGATVAARYVTLTYQVPREQDICVQELRAFSASAESRPGLELGDDVSGAIGDAGSGTSSYTVNGQAAPLLSILRSGGTNYGRLQLLVNPASGSMGLAGDLAAATQLKAAGMKVFLDLEYSDSPTSSTAQATPAAWAGQPLATLARTVQSYTASVLRAFAANGTPVAQVQIGNDVTQGLLWPTGQLAAGPGDPGWGPLATLLKAGAAGARAGNPAGNPLAVQIGIDAGADTTSSLDFFGHLEAAGVSFDQIGETYSPWTQGPLTSLDSTLRALITRFGKPVVISAGQFPYADVTGYGSYSDAVPYPDTLPGYLITPAGQASYERDLVSLLAALPRGLGRGAFYLAPQTASALGEFTPAGAAEPAADAYRVGSGAAGQDPGVPPVSAVPAGTPAAQPSQPASTGNAALPGTLPPLPSGLNAAIGARVSANSGAAPGTSLAGVNDGDGTTRWCPSSAGVHQVTVDLGHVEDVTGTGITFSGQQAGDGATYSVSAGASRPGQTPFPHQAASGHNYIAPGAQYLFSGSAADVTATVPARYLTLTYQVPREENICVQEFRVFVPASAQQAASLETGSDLSTLLSDTGTYTLAGQQMPILSIFRSGGLNYVRLRLWVNPVTGYFGVPSASPFCAASACPDLANDLTMARQVKAAGMKILLDIHYSDTWADPQHQNVPGAWLGETLPQLATSTRNYTQSVIQAFAANGTPVSQVAIGNEITEGLLWQFTQLSGSTAAGTTTIPVDSASGISAGDTLYIDSLANSNSVAGVADPSTDIATVKAVSGNTITLTRPLAHAHAAAATVQDVQDSGHLLFNDSTGTADWNSLTTLIKAGVAGARAGNPAGNPLLIQLHIDRGGDNAAATDFVQHMVAAGVKFDVIGLSYYPWYHGPMTAMKANLTALIDRFGKYVMIAEDQFPYNPIGGYGQYNAANANYPDTLPGYLVTPAGQASYQRDLVSLVASLPGHKGLGVFYWDGDSYSYQGMFAYPGIAQPVIDAYQIGTTPA